MTNGTSDPGIIGRARISPSSLSERLIRTMANSGDRRRREEPERMAEALFLGIIA